MNLKREKKRHWIQRIKERVGIYCNKNIIINTNEEAICSKRGKKIEKNCAQERRPSRMKEFIKM